MILTELLARSRAPSAFRTSVSEFLYDGQPNERIAFDRYSPPVKVARTLTKLLVEHPDLEIDRVEIDGASGCEFYRGTLRIHTAEAVQAVRFHWDCRWRALEVGWTDYFGLPDQARAAREFDYDCFRVWEPA